MKFKILAVLLACFSGYAPAQTVETIFQGPAKGTTITATTAFKAPAGTAAAAAIGPTSEGNTGWWFEAAGGINTAVAGTNVIFTSALIDRFKSSLILGFASGDPESTNLDTTACRQGAGVWQFGTSTTCNSAGTIQAAAMDSGAASNLILKYNGVSTLTIGAANTPLTVAGITTGTNADFLCLSAGGVVLLQTSACTISSLRFKENVQDYRGDGLSVIGALRPIAFTMKPQEVPNADWNFDQPQIGLAAENVAEVAPMAAIYEQDGKTPKSYRQEALLAVAVKAIQEQQFQIQTLTQQVKELRAMQYAKRKGDRYAKVARIVAAVH